MSRWDEVIAAVGAAQQGREGGHEALLAQWEATAVDDHAPRCVLAHYLADGEPELADDSLAAIGIPSARGMAPSLHLNLGDGYLRQGRVEEAQVQLAAGLESADALGDDGYGALVLGGLERLAAHLATGAGDA